MRITFVSEAYESLGIEYLSSSLKHRGHAVTLVYDPQLFNDAFCRFPRLHTRLFPRDLLIRRVLATNPDIVAFSSMSDNYLWNLQMAEDIKKAQEVPVIFGGIHPSSVPERVIQDPRVDLICVGEGEQAFTELADRFDSTGRISAKGIPNLVSKENGEIIINPVGHVVRDLDSLPFPDKFLFIREAPHMAARYYIMTGRGCPFSCTFCYNSTITDKRSYLRRRSVENVIDELKWAMRSDIRFSYVMFGDDTFVQDKKWLFSFLDEYRKFVDKPFVCAIHPRSIDDSVLHALRSSGCSDIEIGVQTLNPKIRHDLLRRQESTEDVFRAMDLIKGQGIRLIVDHIGGIPGETADDYEQAILAYKEHCPNYVAFFWLSYYPKTPILKTAVETGTLSAADQDRIEEGKGLDGRGSTSVVIKRFLGFELLFALVPILPYFLLRWIVRRRYYRLVRKRSIGWMVFLPRLIRSVVDMNLRPFFRQWNRYRDLFFYLRKA